MLTLEVDVLGCQFVASRAVRPGDQDLSGAKRLHVNRRGSREKATQDIDARSNGFEMSGVDAAGNAAEMVDLQSFGDRPLGVFVSETVRLNTGTASSGRDSSVAAPPVWTEPRPATAKWNGYATLEQFVERSGEMLQSGHSLWSLSGGSRSGMPVDRQSHRYSVSTMECAHG